MRKARIVVACYTHYFAVLSATVMWIAWGMLHIRDTYVFLFISLIASMINTGYQKQTKMELL